VKDTNRSEAPKAPGYESVSHGTAMIQSDDQMMLAQQCIANLRRILLAAREVHSQQDYARTAEPVLLEVQQRGQEILEYLSGDR